MSAGATFMAQSFVSTSVRKSVADALSKRVTHAGDHEGTPHLWRLSLPEGTHVVPVNFIGTAFRRDEGEILLPPGTLLQVVSHEDGVTNLEIAKGAPPKLVNTESKSFARMVRRLLTLHFLQSRLGHFVVWQAEAMKNLFTTVALKRVAQDLLGQSDEAFNRVMDKSHGEAVEMMQQAFEQLGKFHAKISKSSKPKAPARPGRSPFGSMNINKPLGRRRRKK
jgi:hypothetical protein